MVLLSDVLCQEGEVCQTMLRLAFQALEPGGLLMIRGYFLDAGAGQGPFAALFDLDRLLKNGTRESLVVERLLGRVEDARFQGARPLPLTERSTCIFADK